MAILDFAFDPSEIEPNSGFNKFPVSGPQGILAKYAGDKLIQFGNADGKASGIALEITFEGADAEHSGCSALYRCNIYSSSEQNQNIARGNLSAIFHCAGISNGKFTDTSVLFGRILRIITQEKTEENGKSYINIVGFMDQAGNKPTTSAQRGSLPPKPGPGKPALPPKNQAQAPQQMQPQQQPPCPTPQQYQQPQQPQYQQPAPGQFPVENTPFPPQQPQYQQPQYAQAPPQQFQPQGFPAPTNPGDPNAPRMPWEN